MSLAGRVCDRLSPAMSVEAPCPAAAAIGVESDSGEGRLASHLYDTLQLLLDADVDLSAHRSHRQAHPAADTARRCHCTADC